MKTLEGYKNRGTYEVYLTGSCSRVKRVVYEKEGRFYVLFYSRLIEVKPNNPFPVFKTIEKY